MSNAYTLSRDGDPNGIEATGVVVSVPWTMNATDGTNTVAISDVLPLQPITPTDPAFIPFDKLTDQIVLGWVEAALNISALCGQLDVMLADKAAPDPVPMALPGTAPVAGVAPPAFSVAIMPVLVDELTPPVLEPVLIAPAPTS